MSTRNNGTREVYATNWTSGRFVQYGDRIEFFASSWSSGTVYESAAEAEAEFNRLVEGLPADWKCEYDCSNRRFSGGFAAMWERVFEEWDGEEWQFVDSCIVDMKVWDGEGWFE